MEIHVRGVYRIVTLQVGQMEAFPCGCPSPGVIAKHFFQQTGRLYASSKTDTIRPNTICAKTDATNIETMTRPTLAVPMPMMQTSPANSTNKSINCANA